MPPAESAKPEVRTRAVSPERPADRLRYDDVLHCNRCGFCTSTCPTYLATGDEALSPRGRNQAFRALVEGRLNDPAEAEKAFSTCLLCGICTSVCFAEVPTAKLMVAAREKVMLRRGEPVVLRWVLRSLLPRPRWLEGALRLLFLGKKLGVSRLLNRLGLLRLVSPQVAAAEEMTEEVPLRFLRSRLKKLLDTPSQPSPKEGRGTDSGFPPSLGEEEGGVSTRVMLFLACGPNYLRPSVGEATFRLVERAGKKADCAANVCCGLPGLSFGDIPAAREMAKRNIIELEKQREAVVLVDDSSCASALKEYPSLFRPEEPEEAGWIPRAEAVSRRVKDLSEWLVENPSAYAFTSKKVTNVTYHDPCKARYAQKIVDAPRAVLRGLPGVSYVELPEADQCCGGGGTYSFVHPDISRKVLERKVGCIRSTGAQLVLTSSVSCLLQLAFGLRRTGSNVRALHLSEFLAARLE